MRQHIFQLCIQNLSSREYMRQFTILSSCLYCNVCPLSKRNCQKPKNRFLRHWCSLTDPFGFVINMSAHPSESNIANRENPILTALKFSCIKLQLERPIRMCFKLTSNNNRCPFILMLMLFLRLSHMYYSHTGMHEMVARQETIATGVNFSVSH